MGALNSRLFHKKGHLMLDKANFTSEFSINSAMTSEDSCDSFSQFISTIEEAENNEAATISVPLDAEASKESIKLIPQIRMEACSSNNNLQISEKLRSFELEHKSENLNRKQEIEKLGINKISYNKAKQYYDGIIYLPECEIVMVHYLALYRLKLDTISQYDFENWCLKKGHIKTSKKYSILVNVYNKMKENHFKDSFIINRIISRQNVNFHISDIFGEESKFLRSLTVTGDRRSTVQNVLECYYFAIRGKISFVIKSADDYKRYTKISTQLKSNNCDLTNSYSNSSYRVVKSRLTVESRKQVGISSDTYSNVFEVLNIHPNSLNDVTMNSNTAKTCNSKTSTQLGEPIQNYMRFQRKEDNVEGVCYNNPIHSNGGTYNLVSIIADKTYAYILCRNSDSKCKDFEDVDLSLLDDEDLLLTPDCGLNQSNSFNRIGVLKKILRTEIMECCNKKFYGVALSKVPCGEFYVVRCCMNKTLEEREGLLNEILIRHMVCGKLISKEYNLDSHLQREAVMHLHGNEHSVLNCCKELKYEGLAYDFQLIRPNSSGNRESKERQPYFI